MDEIMDNSPAGPGGAPTKYIDIFSHQAEKLTSEGKSMADLATYFCVHRDTIYEWRKVHEQFSDSIKRGRDNFVKNDCQKSLHEVATGYDYEEEQAFCTRDGELLKTKVKRHAPPNVTALIFTLCNLMPEKYKRKDQEAATGDFNFNITVSPEQNNEEKKGPETDGSD